LFQTGATVIAGQGPLLWLLAAQILRLGGRIDPSSTPPSAAIISPRLPHAFAS